MDYNNILTVLTSFKKGNNNDEIIEETVNKAFALLPENDKELIQTQWNDLNIENNIRWKYVLLSILIIKAMKETNLNNKDDKFSFKQIQLLKTAMEILILLGIKPNCIIYDNPPKSNQTDLIERFNQLVHTANFFIECFDDFLLLTCALSHLGSILPSFIFIAHVVITPTNAGKSVTDSNYIFVSPESYDKLINIQKEFREKLLETMNKCPIIMIMKELMIIHGTPKYPKFMRMLAKKYVVGYIIKPNGVLSLISTMCNVEDPENISNHWDKLELAAKLLAVSHGNDIEEYYNSICSQLITLLKTTTFSQSIAIAKCCVKALYEYNAKVCMEKIFNNIATPFFYIENKTWNEQKLTESIEILSKCFVSPDADFKQLPAEMLIPIALPLFTLYIKSINSISSLRHKIKQIALKIFSIEAIREELFSLFLNYNIKFNHNYGNRLNFQLSDSGDFEIIGTLEEVDQEELANALFELVKSDKTISFELFHFLLKSLSEEKSTSNVLETNLDVINSMTKQLLSVNLLILLANLSLVQKSNLEKPELLLSFVTSLIEKRIKSEKKEIEEDEMDIGYIGLMLVKVILSESKNCLNWLPFEEFVSFLNSKKVFDTLTSNSKELVEEITKLVRLKGKSEKKFLYEDLSEKKEKSDFEKALEDLSNKLLPVQAHGLIALTKLIEKGDLETMNKKDILICIFQENLKNEDSFIYLAAINALCALATRFPQNVIEILMQEFIKMPQINDQDSSSKNRAKLGEILVKTTRNLGEMAVVHKKSLINCFLCVIKESDPLVCASSLSCLGELCKIFHFNVDDTSGEILYCIGKIIQTNKEPDCRRAAVLVITLLFQGLGKDVLTRLNHDLLWIYKSLKFLRDNDNDDVIRLHAQIALEEINDIVKNQLFAKPKLEKEINLFLN